MATENKIVWLNLIFFNRVKEMVILTEIYCASDILCNDTITKTFNARKGKNKYSDLFFVTVRIPISIV